MIDPNMWTKMILLLTQFLKMNTATPLFPSLGDPDLQFKLRGGELHVQTLFHLFFFKLLYTVNQSNHKTYTLNQFYPI